MTYEQPAHARNTRGVCDRSAISAPTTDALCDRDVREPEAPTQDFRANLFVDRCDAVDVRDRH